MDLAFESHYETSIFRLIIKFNSQIEKVAYLGLVLIVGFSLLSESCSSEHGILSLTVLRFCMKQDVDSVEIASGSPLPGVKVIVMSTVIFPA